MAPTADISANAEVAQATATAHDATSDLPVLAPYPLLVVAQTEPLLAVATTKRGTVSATAPRRSA